MAARSSEPIGAEEPDYIMKEESRYDAKKGTFTVKTRMVPNSNKSVAVSLDANEKESPKSLISGYKTASKFMPPKSRGSIGGMSIELDNGEEEPVRSILTWQWQAVASKVKKNKIKT